MAGPPGAIVGAIAGAAVGLGVSVYYLFKNTAEDTRIEIQKIIDDMNTYRDVSDRMINYPLEIYFSQRINDEYGSENIKCDIQPWSGTVVSGTGKPYYKGSFMYIKYTKQELMDMSAEFEKTLENAFR